MSALVNAPSTRAKTRSTRAVIAIIGVIALLLGLGACSSGGNADLVGVWQLDSIDAGAAGSFSGDDIPAAVQMTFTINADGTASLKGDSQNETGKWVRNGDTITLTADTDTDGGTIDLTLKDGKLTGSMDDYKIVFVKK